MKFFPVFFFAAFNLLAQSNINSIATDLAVSKMETNQPIEATQRTEQIRTKCLQGRRLICGRITKVLPDGLVIESGYLDLLHPPLNKSWLIPGDAGINRTPNMIESRRPESPCIGIIYLTDLPKSRTTKPKQYDFVTLLGYPTGQYAYTSIGTIHKTVRRFSANLLKAVKQNADAAENGTSF
jgi:hypothetical protein